MEKTSPFPISSRRELPAILDADLAKVDGVPTKCLNEQVKCNFERFPEDFCFQLIAEEKAKVVANCDHLKTRPTSPTLGLLSIFIVILLISII